MDSGNEYFVTYHSLHIVPCLLLTISTSPKRISVEKFIYHYKHLLECLYDWGRQERMDWGTMTQLFRSLGLFNNKIFTSAKYILRQSVSLTHSTQIEIKCEYGRVTTKKTASIYNTGLQIT